MDYQANTGEGFQRAPQREPGRIPGDYQDTTRKDPGHHQEGSRTPPGRIQDTTRKDPGHHQEGSPGISCGMMGDDDGENMHRTSPRAVIKNTSHITRGKT
jgi:hypothetical protein